MKQLVQTILLLSFALAAHGQAVPENASNNPYGTGWTCNRGYSRSGNACVEVQIPENAKLNYLGSGWECSRGFYRSGQECRRVEPPLHANLNYLGNGWECNRGYRRAANACLEVSPPENARLNYLGNGWECNRGYHKTGESCTKVVTPQNAHLNTLGNGWDCDPGFKRANQECVAMTAQELQKREELERAIRAQLERRRAEAVSGDDCESEYKSNASVCVEITGGNLNCNESYGDDYYQDCDVSLSYEVRSDYRGRAYLDVDVECTVEIEYKGRGSYITRLDSNTQDESHTLYAYGHEDETLSFNFSFGSYEAVTSVKIASAACEIDSIDLY